MMFHAGCVNLIETHECLTFMRKWGLFPGGEEGDQPQIFPKK